VAAHAIDNDHGIDRENSIILNQEDDFFKRRIKEAILIKFVSFRRKNLLLLSLPTIVKDLVKYGNHDPQGSHQPQIVSYQSCSHLFQCTHTFLHPVPKSASNTNTTICPNHYHFTFPTDRKDDRFNHLSRVIKYTSQGVFSEPPGSPLLAFY